MGDAKPLAIALRWSKRADGLAAKAFSAIDLNMAAPTYLITTLIVRSIGVRHWLNPELLKTSATLVLSGFLHR